MVNLLNHYYIILVIFIKMNNLFLNIKHKLSMIPANCVSIKKNNCLYYQIVIIKYVWNALKNY